MVPSLAYTLAGGGNRILLTTIGGPATTVQRRSNAPSCRVHRPLRVIWPDYSSRPQRDSLQIVIPTIQQGGGEKITIRDR